MVPSLLPAKITIRQALDRYLESKGVPVPLVNNHNHKVANKETTTKEEEDSTEQETTTTSSSSSSLPTDRNPVPVPVPVPVIPLHKTSTTKHPPHILSMTKRSNATRNGLTRPTVLPCFSIKPCSFVSCILPKSTNSTFWNKGTTTSCASANRNYGGEHLMRLFCRLPSILADAFGDGDDDEDTVKPILAKLNDLAWFFTKESIDTVLSIIPQKE